MVSSPAVRRLVVVSDLHLDAHSPDADRDAGSAFTSFLTSVVLADDAPGARLVLLGDAFELLDSSASGGGDAHAIWHLGDIAAAHPALFATLNACLRRGWHLDVVPGNHDMALAHPAVHRQLAMLVGAQAGSQMRVHPWVYHVPGVLYAEHGHQHHDLNRFPMVLTPDDPRSGQLFLPPLGAWQGTISPRVFRALADSRRYERAAWSSAYRATIEEHALLLGLPTTVVADLHGLSRFRLSTTALRLARRALSRPRGADPDAYMIAAAGRIHALLTQAGDAVPVYAFGHTHRARTVALSDQVWYVNTGTWSADVRGTGPDRNDPHLFPYLDLDIDTIRSDANHSAHSLRYWHWPKIDTTEVAETRHKRTHGRT